MKKLRIAAITAACLFVIIQIVELIVFFGVPQYSDQIFHLKCATNAFNENLWYPTVNNLHDDFIVAPGLINFLILQLRLFGTTNYNGVFQLFMNVAMLYEVFYIAKHFFTEKVSYIATIIYCLLISNYVDILIWGTEMPFLFLGMTGFCLCLKKKWYNVLLASVLFAMSNTIRPISLLFVVIILIYLATNKVNWKHYALLCIPYFALNFGYGKINEARIGHFVNTSTTGGTNLLQTAHDKADGTTANGLIIMYRHPKYAYMKNRDKTVFEKDKMWKDAGIDWIKKNPTKYLKMFFYKVPYMYADDTWPVRICSDQTVTQCDQSNKTKLMLSLIAMNIPYYCIFILALLSVLLFGKKLYSDHKGSFILLLYLIMGTAGTVIMPVLPRYHYPFMFTIVILAAYSAECIYNKRTKKS